MKTIDAKETEIAVTFPELKRAIERVKDNKILLSSMTPAQIHEVCFWLKTEVVSHTFLAAPAIEGVRIAEPEECSKCDGSGEISFAYNDGGSFMDRETIDCPECAGEKASA